MIRYLSLAAALAVAFMAEPLYAKHPHGRGGGGKHAPAVAAHRSAPRAHAPIARQQKAHVQTQRNIAAQKNAAAQRQRNLQAQRSVAAQRQQNLQAHRSQAVRNQRHSVAFGGTTRITNNSRIDVRNRSYYRPPADVYRHWHHGREYSWNHHRYHWRDGAWVIIDAGPSYYYDEPAVVYRSFDSDVSVLASVQARLNREGYDAGPADGILGGRTSSAIAAYQEDHDLKVTVDVTDSLLRSLDLK
jgi:hypothetical protein